MNLALVCLCADEDPDGVEARMKAALASKQQDQEQDGGEEGLPRAGDAWGTMLDALQPSHHKNTSNYTNAAVHRPLFYYGALS